MADEVVRPIAPGPPVAVTEAQSDAQTDDFLDGILKLNAKLAYDNAALKSQILFYDDLQDRRLKRQNDQILFMQAARQNDSRFIDETLEHEQSIAHRDIAIASEWDVPGSEAIAAATAEGAGAVAEKGFATINANLPGGNTLPGGGSPTTGG